jgi:iron(III) transport system substrate-binding protein
MSNWRLIGSRLVVGVLILLLGAGLALADGTLVIYNAGPPEMGNDLVKAFNAKHSDIKVEMIRAGSGELLTRVRAEASRPQGDIIMAIAKENLEAIRDFLQPYKVREDAAFPDDVKDTKENKYYGFSFNIQAFIINTRVVSLNDAPKSWKELGDKKWRGKIVLANPALSGSAYAQLFQMVGLYGWDFINKIRRVSTFVPKSTLVYTFVGRGEFPIGVTGEGNVFGEINKGNPVAAVYPSEGTGLRFDASGIIKNGPNLNNAKIFMDWLTTKEAMSIISKAPHFRRMARPDVPPPPGLKPNSEIKFFAYDAIKASKSRNDYLQKFGEIFSQRK